MPGSPGDRDREKNGRREMIWQEVGLQQGGKREKLWDILTMLNILQSKKD